MGVEPPFIYDRPSSYTFGGPTDRAFNPRAATQASWSPPPQRIKKDGPLIEFNRHPDSYVSVPYGNLNVVPMNPKTKERVIRARKYQLALRTCALLGAIGCLFCVITIRKTTDTAGWIIRVGPAVAFLHSVYAIYHFSKNATSRPPASTASYQVFAGLIDAGLIPFFALTSYMAWRDYKNNAYEWDTIFRENIIDYKIIQAFSLLTTIEGGLFVISLFLDIYLGMTFRKIAMLPPDFNPLEERDNLTARPRHKRNKSELMYEKHLSNSTLATQRFSQQNSPEVAGRRIPFIHTRTDSADKLTLYGSEAAKDSRVSLRKELTAESNDPYGNRSSVLSSAGTLVPSRPTSAITPAENVRQAGAGLDNKPARSSGLARQTTNGRPSSWLSYMNHEGCPVDMSDYAQQQLDHQVRPLSPVSALSNHERPDVRTSFEDENITPQEEDYDPYSTAHLSNSLAPPAYSSPPRKRSLEPLGMNPPTPVNGGFQNENIRDISQSKYAPAPLSISTPTREVLRETDANAAEGRPSLGSRPASFVGSGGKSRFYGDLRTSLGGNHHISHDEMHDILGRSGTVKSEESGNFEVYGSDSDDDYGYGNDSTPAPAIQVAKASPVHSNRNSPVRMHESEWMAGQDIVNGQRQVSNSTGYDLNNGYAGLGAEFGRGMAARRREVSGKIAEEGRGTGNFEDSTQHVSHHRPAAAGWARFKGL